MKRLLMATTAVALVGGAAGEAYGQATAAGPVRLGLAGYFQFYGVGGSQSNDAGEPGAHTHNFDFKREAEIHFSGTTKLDNGLIIGVQVELEAESCTDQIDESYIWFQGNWGRLLLGSTNSAAYKLAVGAPTVDANFDGQDPNYRIFNGVVGDPRGIGTLIGTTKGAPAGSGTSGIDAYVPNISGDSEKVTYLSPRIFGFRAGVSYTPDNTEEGNTVGGGQISVKGGSFAGMPPNNNIGQFSNVITGGLNYEGKAGPVDLLAGIGYEWGKLERSADFPVPGGVVGGWKNRQSWQGGVDVGFAGFHFGGGYYYDDNGFRTSGTQRSWALGLTYTIGPLTVGGSYFDSSRDRATASGLILPDEDLKRYLIGARYELGPGVDLRGSVQRYDYDAGPNDGSGVTANNKSWFGVVGTVLTF